MVEIKLHYEDLNKHSILQLYKAARHYLDKNSDWSSDPAPFYKNHTKFYLDAKHLKTGLNRGWIGSGEIRGALFFKEKAFFDQYRILA